MGLLFFFAIGLLSLGLIVQSIKLIKTQKKSDEMQVAFEMAINTSRLELESSKRYAISLENSLAKAEQWHSALVEAEAQRRELSVMLDKERGAFKEKMNYMQDLHETLSNQFKAISADVLRNNNESFLHLAKKSFEQLQVSAKSELDDKHKSLQTLMNPIQDALKQVDSKIQELETKRVGAYEGLKQHLSTLVESQKLLHDETSNLVKALRTPIGRGQWGELQLKRVVEMAGMLAHCDFIEQPTLAGEARLRPDMIINLPGNKKIVVDSKAPLAGYLDALEAKTEPEKQEHLKRHARHIRQHIRDLSSKSYWDHISIQPAPDFVVLFLPGEVFFSSALEQDPALIEAGVQEKVILATPTTLIALLRAIAFGWRQEKVTANTEEITRIGKELYKRLSDVGNHFSRLGRHISQVVDSYNQSVGSLEKRVLVSARKLHDLNVVETAELLECSPIEATPRNLYAPELLLKEEVEEI